MLGLIWSVLVPILLLSVYTFVFSVVFEARWSFTLQNRYEFAIILFSGLIVYNLFAECITRAPGLMLANLAYIKKVVFPLEILPWVTLFVALFNATVSSAVLMLGYLIVLGLPPIQTLILPLAVLPLLLLVLGFSLFLSSVGVFIRDLEPLTGLVVMVMMFLSPIFYPITSIPEKLRVWILLSPLTSAIESVRLVLFSGGLPDLTHFSIYLLVSLTVLWLGHAWFIKTRKGFADVV